MSSTGMTIGITVFVALVIFLVMVGVYRCYGRFVLFLAQIDYTCLYHGQESALYLIYM